MKPYLGICTACGALLVRQSDDVEPTNLGYHEHPGGTGAGGAFLVRVVFEGGDGSKLDQQFADLAPPLP